MNIKIITLPHAKERQEKTKINFNLFDLSFNFVNGIELKDCSFYTDTDSKTYVKCKDQNFYINEAKIINYTNRNWIRFGEIGAYLAHYFVWKDFLNSSDEHIVVCEDDAEPKSNLSKLEKLFQNTNVDFLNLQAVTAHYQAKMQFFVNPIVEYEEPGVVKYKNYIPLLCEGLAAYAMNRKAAKILCNYIEEYGFVGPNDCLTAQIAIQNILPMYSPYDVENYFMLDRQTYQTSYTHTGEFKPYIKMNNITLNVKV